MTRREVRDSAFKIIYQSLLRDDTAEELFEAAIESEEIPVDDDVKLMVKDVLSKAPQLDEMITKFSKKRTFPRIAKINVAILRIAFYEILFNDRIPTNAAIKEAVVLAQNYSQKEDVAFINGVLGAYSRSSEVSDSENEGN
ncbi:MAG: transcription antitermination factor NusB [Oscillospiraceae bacterium]|nr:transcription antitermination factor NusB [Oscillospiraceae bacterium]